METKATLHLDHASRQKLTADGYRIFRINDMQVEQYNPSLSMFEKLKAYHDEGELRDVIKLNMSAPKHIFELAM